MAKRRLTHAYMLIGQDTPARRSAAQLLAAELLCTGEEPPCRTCRDCRKVLAGVHPDVIYVERQPGDKGQLHKELLVDQIRWATADAATAPNEAARKVYILPEADRMNLPAQNALLKALEDPPGHACFLLCASSSDALLPTVRSRCIRVDETERAQALPPLSDLSEAFLTLAAGGSVPEMTRFWMLRTRLTREEADTLLEELTDALGDILCARRPDPGLCREEIFRWTALLEQGRDYLRHNVAPKQVFGVLAAEA